VFAGWFFVWLVVCWVFCCFFGQLPRRGLNVEVYRMLKRYCSCGRPILLYKAPKGFQHCNGAVFSQYRPPPSIGFCQVSNSIQICWLTDFSEAFPTADAFEFVDSETKRLQCARGFGYVFAAFWTRSHWFSRALG